MYKWTAVIGIIITYPACKIPVVTQRNENRSVPAAYNNATGDTTNSASVSWKSYFTDPYLAKLIDTALVNNQELNISLQEIEIARNEARARKGEYLPFVGFRGAAGIDKAGRYTTQGAVEHYLEIKPNSETPEPLGDLLGGFYATWEIDAWKKLRNARKAAISRYLASIEGRNFTVTNLVSEIANSYYELLALDNQLAIVRNNINILTNALEIVKLEKEAARVTELAVRKFEAEVLATRSMQFDIQQQITETENRINFLAGRFPGHVDRNTDSMSAMVPGKVAAGMPAQLLSNRPDVRQAERELEAARLDVKVARARFYPSIGITAAAGYNAFNPSYFLKTPESLIYGLAGELTAPIVNRNAIKAMYYSANAKQMQAVYNYERTVLNAYMEVANQLSKINNLDRSYELKAQQVAALNQSYAISNDLFKSARADYMEVLLTQRDALQSKFELVETRKQQMNAFVNVYRALGGGWR